MDLNTVTDWLQNKVGYAPQARAEGDAPPTTMSDWWSKNYPGIAGGALGLAPLLGMLKMKRTSSYPLDGTIVPRQRDNWRLLNEGAGEVGDMATTYTPHNKNIHIDYMDSNLHSPLEQGSPGHAANSASWSLGPENMASLIEEGKRHFPDAQTTTFTRASGARLLADQNQLYDPTNTDYFNPRIKKLITKKIPGR